MKPQILLPKEMLLLDSASDFSVTGELVSEKILRPSATARLPRSRLLAVLNQSLSSCNSTIICGRAGSGKTSLAIDFSLCSRRQTAWYKLDAPDGELRIFFQYLIASIQNQRAGFGTRALAALVAIAKREHIPLLAEVFAYELSEDEGSLLIVIEDLHHVSDSEWLVPFFRRLLPLLPSDVHVLITSRTMPPAPLWRMRSKQALVVVDEEALAFTRAEAIELFESHGLSVEQATIALDHTHGRAGALSSFAHSLSQTERQHVSLTADTREYYLPNLSEQR